MKKFIQHILCFSLPAILLAFTLDKLISDFLKATPSFAVGEVSVWNEILNNKTKYEILIYGSSRAWIHIDPTLIAKSFNSSCYNMGVDGHPFGLQYFRHSMIMKNGKSPKVIIYSLDVSTLTRVNDLYNYQQFLPYMIFNKDFINGLFNYNGFKSADFYIPLIRYSGELNAVLNARNKSIATYSRVNGYQAQDLVWNDDFDKAKKEMADFRIKLDSTTVRLFDRYLHECKQKNIQVVFVFTPEYIDGQKFVSNREEVFELYKKFSKKYDIPFFDYSNDKICRQQMYFYNAEHLNKQGSELFTKKLIDTLKRSSINLHKFNF